MDKNLVEDILKGKEKSAARLISQVENGNREAYEALSRLLPYTGRAHIIGITGPAGAGKSTLIGRLAVSFADQGKKVAVIATDPTSMKNKGAFLGDRLRMKEAEEKQIFIRSMAHRGYPGGVARAARGAIYVLEGLGKDLIILESIGAGQSEKELFNLCDTIITLFTPEYGDDIQFFKAGLMEIGDIIIINKADKPGADDAARVLAAHILLKETSKEWKVPVLLTQAHSGEGLEAAVLAIETHWQNLGQGGQRTQNKKEKAEAFMIALLKEELWKRFSLMLSRNDLFKQQSEDVRDGKSDPYSAVEMILDGMGMKE
ncbi:MAG: methylmalonyl Co-A mutase-associated GTPase MeaB [Syntrophus sp. (in: bacteria)]|nr:methylmalonyl Co-A mutase-associated GTPase MeaB [Syntrophus sp. (in: bacteria)]